MTSALNDALVSTWVTGWSRCRNYDVQHDGVVHASLRSGVQAGDGQDWEYVLAHPDETALKAVSTEVQNHPGRLLTVVGPPPTVPAGVPLKALSTGEKLMVVNMGGQDVEAPIVPEEFEATVERKDPDWFLVTITSTEEHPQGEGAVAARGRVAAVDGYAVFDRIWTSPEFRRQGLGSLVMRYLASLALEHDVEEGLLVASADGQALYGHLGWTELADVTVYGALEGDTGNPSHSDAG
ncbi:GNAT family N-acetyltransferase [Citricoccus sp. K5]|uniref:GNAT family N-acetyltransferase n=1 Tax=Citricoccus sp. K5 TaxID=2653135 RepID=UPI0012F42F0C|nr:GNAT family N-acetyltransferase [Citricoccus sp. K5]VXB77322.1 Acetyltransferase (GNAT) family protein [Citricoccus sp. K5]